MDSPAYLANIWPLIKDTLDQRKEKKRLAWKKVNWVGKTGGKRRMMPGKPLWFIGGEMEGPHWGRKNLFPNWYWYFPWQSYGSPVRASDKSDIHWQKLRTGENGKNAVIFTWLKRKPRGGKNTLCPMEKNLFFPRNRWHFFSANVHSEGEVGRCIKNYPIKGFFFRTEKRGNETGTWENVGVFITIILHYVRWVLKVSLGRQRGWDMRVKLCDLSDGPGGTGNIRTRLLWRKKSFKIHSFFTARWIT